MQEFDHVSIKSLDLSKRTYHALSRSGVLTIGDLRVFYTNREKYRVRSIGDKSLGEIAKALENLNMNLSQLVLEKKIQSK
jgi:DNA-directed RNA polymerase alpha subunit